MVLPLLFEDVLWMHAKNFTLKANPHDEIPMRHVVDKILHRISIISNNNPIKSFGSSILGKAPNLSVGFFFHLQKKGNLL
jgi:hypothetical protein